MLRITTNDTNGTILMRIEGKLSGPWVAELEQIYATWKAQFSGKPFVLDLDGLTGTDAAGRYLLALIQGEGAVLKNAPLLDVSPAWGAAKDRDVRCEVSQ